MPKKQELKPQENVLWLDGGGYKICISKSAEKIKAELLDSASRIKCVEDNDSALVAKAQRDDINKMLIEVEKTRKLVKEPVLQKGKEIDQVASSFTMDLTAEKLRLDKLIGDFAYAQELVRRQAAEAAMRAAQEQQRLQQEAEEAAAAAERKRLGAEQAEAEAQTRREQAAARAAQEQAEAEQRKADELAARAGAAGMSAHHSSMTVMDTRKVSGTSVVLDYELENVHLLYGAMPHLVEMTPKRRDILAFLNQQKQNGLPVGLPGLKIVEKTFIR